jgi:uncharacterized damage-inducible protein DinB
MNSTIEGFIAEFDHESAATGRLLDRLPADRLSWRPHPKSMSLGELGLHVATIPGGMATLLEGPGVEAADILIHPEAVTVEQILQAWQQTIATFHEKIPNSDDGDRPWSVNKDGKPAVTVPKSAARRLFMLNHWYHHRGQLTVYLRLLDVPLPAVYAASADENPFVS